MGLGFSMHLMLPNAYIFVNVFTARLNGFDESVIFFLLGTSLVKATPLSRRYSDGLFYAVSMRII